MVVLRTGTFLAASHFALLAPGQFLYFYKSAAAGDAPGASPKTVSYNIYEDTAKHNIFNFTTDIFQLR
jgi:hypothetical protein